jgi:uncharacterized protein (TIGR02594 family)
MSKANRPNPYPGLRPFEPEDEAYFFGREAQTKEILNLLRRKRFLAVLGASGSGKSSMVKAGLVASLRAGFLVDDPDGWRIVIMRPGDTPLRAMYEAYKQSYWKTGGEFDDHKELEQLTSETRALAKLWGRTRDPRDEKLLIVVDQFEELFRFDSGYSRQSSDEVRNFVALILEAAKDPTAPIHIVLTMRSEFLGDCAQFPNLTRTINGSAYLVHELDTFQMTDAMVKPAALGKVKLTRGLVTRLLEDTKDEAVPLPLLQHSLMRMWNHTATLHQRDLIEMADYITVGTIRTAPIESAAPDAETNALGIHGAEILQDLGPVEHEVAEVIFRTLTRIDDAGRMTRQPTALADIENAVQRRLGGNHLQEEHAPKETKDLVRRVLAVFRDPSNAFISPFASRDESDELTGETKLDITHEALIFQWNWLRQWTISEAVVYRTVRQFEDFARTWKEHGEGWRQLAPSSLTGTIAKYHRRGKYTPRTESERKFYRRSRWKSWLVNARFAVVLSALVLLPILAYGFKVVSMERDKAEVAREKESSAREAAERARDEEELAKESLRNEVNLLTTILREAQEVFPELKNPADRQQEQNLASYDEAVIRSSWSQVYNELLQGTQRSAAFKTLLDIARNEPDMVRNTRPVPGSQPVDLREIRIENDDSLGGLDLSGYVLNRVHFRNSNLKNSNLSYVQAVYADFRDATLTNVNFQGADLRWADFEGADLSDAQFNGAKLDDAWFVGVKSINGARGFEDVGSVSGAYFDLSNVEELPEGFDGNRFAAFLKAGDANLLNLPTKKQWWGRASKRVDEILLPGSQAYDFGTLQTYKIGLFYDGTAAADSDLAGEARQVKSALEASGFPGEITLRPMDVSMLMRFRPEFNEIRFDVQTEEQAALSFLTYLGKEAHFPEPVITVPMYDYKSDNYISFFVHSLTPLPDNSWLSHAWGEMLRGVREIPGDEHEPRILEYLSTIGLSDADETPWDSAFVNWCLQQADFSGTGNGRSRSWLDWGIPLDQPKPGCIAVFWRGSEDGMMGHVGFYMGQGANHIHVLGGNQDNAVRVGQYGSDRLLGYREPATANSLQASEVSRPHGGPI